MPWRPRVGAARFLHLKVVAIKMQLVRAGERAGNLGSGRRHLEIADRRVVAPDIGIVQERTAGALGMIDRARPLPRDDLLDRIPQPIDPTGKDASDGDDAVPLEGLDGRPVDGGGLNFAQRSLLRPRPPRPPVTPLVGEAACLPLDLGRD